MRACQRERRSRVNLRAFYKQKILCRVAVLAFNAELPLMYVEMARGAGVGFEVGAVEAKINVTRAAICLGVSSGHRELRIR